MNPAIVSNRPDPNLLEQLVTVETICLVVATAIAGIVFCAWMVPAVGLVLPGGWSLMKANTALSVLLCSASLVLIRPKPSARLFFAGQASASVAVFLACAALIEHWSGRSSGLSTLLAADGRAQSPGRMSIQTAIFLLLLGFSLVIERTQQGRLGQVLDALLMLLVTFALVLVSGYLFEVPVLYGQSPFTRTSPQTLVCLMSLTLVQVVRRAPYGYYSPLVGVGIGSQFARIALPVSVALTYAFARGGAELAATGFLSIGFAAGLAAASMTALLLVLIVSLARKINSLEGSLREMSVADELTGLHNRRGFYLLGEQALREARRAGKPLTAFYFDVDGLKEINDTLGHNIGSRLLRDLATLLRASFRGDDVVGRLGGDEFAVIAQGREPDLRSALRRLNDAIAVANGAAGNPYRISVSAGGATAEAQSSETFAALVDRADAAMYEMKRRRPPRPEAGGDTQPIAAPDAPLRQRNVTSSLNCNSDVD